MIPAHNGGHQVIHQFNAHQLRRGLMRSSVDRRAADLRKFSRWLDPGTLTDATVADVDAFIGCRNWEPRTTYAFLSHLHAFYKWACRQGICDVDPTEYIDRPRFRQGLPRPIADDDLAYLIAHAAPVMRAWILCGALAGLRCAEIAGLARGDINEAHHQMRVLGKGQRERIVPMHPHVLAGLRAVGMPRTGALWHTATGLTVTGTVISHQGNRYMRAMGVDATMHQLRHWFGTSMYRSSQDLLATAGTMGHANTATTAIYAQFDQKVATAAVLSLTI
jgi:site-specific recombinase XerC